MSPFAPATVFFGSSSIMILTDAIANQAPTDWPGILTGIAAVLGGVGTVVATVVTLKKQKKTPYDDEKEETIKFLLEELVEARLKMAHGEGQPDDKA